MSTSRQRANRNYYLRNRDRILRKAKEKRLNLMYGEETETESETGSETETETETETSDTSSEKLCNPCIAINDKKAKNICLEITKSGKRNLLGLLPEGRTGITEYKGAGDFFQIPNSKGKRDCLYICAPQQSGKSTYVGRYLKQFVKKYPKKTIYLFSKKPKDPSLDKYNPLRIDANKYKLKDNTLDLFKGSMVVFDDVDQYHDKKISKKIYNTINEILCNGADWNISIVITNHNTTDFHKTRTILNECETITLFCKAGNDYQLDSLLKKYIGMGTKAIEKLKSLDSRWVTISKNYPRAVFYDGGMYLL